MSILIKRFDVKTAVSGHEGTILASNVLPDGLSEPFWHQYGYLANNGAMAGHSHDTDEIYIVLSGSGYVIVGGQNKAVCAGDVVAIPSGCWHTMLCTNNDSSPFLWAALWWKPVSDSKAFGSEIQVQRFEKTKAKKAHQGTILADIVVPESMPTPFGHAYGYLENGNEMESHSHPTEELYIVNSGKGWVTIGNEKREVEPGDVIAIPRNETHTMTAQESGEFLWAALWWE